MKNVDFCQCQRDRNLIPIRIVNVHLDPTKRTETVRIRIPTRKTEYRLVFSNLFYFLQQVQLENHSPPAGEHDQVKLLQFLLF
jgi:hypothetical protein